MHIIGSMLEYDLDIEGSIHEEQRAIESERGIDLSKPVNSTIDAAPPNVDGIDNAKATVVNLQSRNTLPVPICLEDPIYEELDEAHAQLKAARLIYDAIMEDTIKLERERLDWIRRHTKNYVGLHAAVKALTKAEYRVDDVKRRI